MYQEQQLAIQEYTGVNPEDPFIRRIIGDLKEPTRLVAEWYNKVVENRAFYKQVCPDCDDPKGWKAFKTEFDRRAEVEKGLRNPYMIIGRDWRPLPMNSVPEVAGAINELAKRLPPIAKFIRRKIEGKTGSKPKDGIREDSYLQFADFLDLNAELLPKCQFEEIIESYLNLPPDLQIDWFAAPVEYTDDPLGLKAAPQAVLAYSDPILTEAANSKLARLCTVGERLYGEPPTAAQVRINNMIIASGWIGLSGRKISGQNFPNSDTAEKVAIRIYPNRLDLKTSQLLAPAVLRVLGIKCAFEDVYSYILGHEGAHGYRPKGEAERLGPMRSSVREGWADARCRVMEAGTGDGDEELRQVIIGGLGFACDDIGQKLEKVVFERGDQPTVDQILAVGSYALGGYLELRRLYLAEAIRHPFGFIDYDKTMRVMEELDDIYSNIACAGKVETAKKYMTEILERRKFFSIGSMIQNATEKLRQVRKTSAALF